MQSFSQFVLRSAVYSGINSRELVPDLFKGLGAQRIVLFSDRGLEKAGVVEKVIETFTKTSNGNKLELVGIYLDIAQDAESKSVNNAVRFAREVKANGLLAVGGGSVLDTVKGIKYALYKELTDIKEAIPKGLLFEPFPKAKQMAIPHIAIPTTAGTGSEVSPIAVIFNEDLQTKGNIINPYISADVAVLDPELTVDLPPKITASTGFDALTHAIEALVSPRATPFTDAQALHSIRLIEKNLPLVVAEGRNLEARLEMLYASLMGITAFSFALNAIPVHNFAHAYGALFRIPHGLANAVFLPIVMEHIPELYTPKIKELAEALQVTCEEGTTKPSLLSKVIEKIRLLQINTGIPSDFSESNLTKEDLLKVSVAVRMDPAAAAFPMESELIQAIGRKVIPLEANDL